MKNAKAVYLSAMFIFGSIGLFARNIDLSSGQTALVRGVLGCAFLLIACLVMRQKLSWKSIRPYLLWLFLSGAGIGFNWIFLFQAYRYTTIANATLSYYFAPVFIMFLSPFLLKERLTATKVFCILGAILGMFLIVGIGFEAGKNHLVGIAYGMSAAILYAGVVITNKHFKGLSGIETTLIQIGSASLILLPYILLTEKIHIFSLDLKSTIFLVTVGLFHTGFAYLLYFTAIRHLSGQTIAVFSYIDPISAIILASIIFREPMTILQVIGGILILGATFVSEISDRKKKGKEPEPESISNV